MAPHRKALLALSLVLVGGSLAWTTAYGLHRRSDAYRREVEADLTRFFELPCDVGRIRGRTFSSRQFEDVDIWLPDRRDRVFFCKRAVWREEQQAGQEANQLDLADGVLMLGTDRWARSDYRQVLASGLNRDLERLRLYRINMERFEISFDCGGLTLRCRETAGAIDMTNPADGVAQLTAYEFNGRRVSQGVRIHARFVPSKTIAVSEINLTLPQIPLADLGVGAPHVRRVSSGTFAGQVQYLAKRPDPEIWISGEVRDADLSEWTERLALGPLKGLLSVKVDAARLCEGALTHLRGQGSLVNLELAPFGPLLQETDLAGVASLRLDAVDLVDDRLKRLSLRGDIHELSLDQWLRPLGRGTATGDLAIRIDNLELVDDRIKSADVELRLHPPKGKPGTLDRALLMAAAEKLFHFTWPASLPQEILPDKITYVDCGLRLIVRDNQLRVLGTHGTNGDTILTISVFGQPFGVIREQPAAIDLGPWMDRLWAKIHDLPPQRLRGLLDSTKKSKPDGS